MAQTVQDDRNELHGRVSVLSELGFGYVVEVGSNRQYFLARDHVDPAAYDALSVGDELVFIENGNNVVASFKPAAALQSLAV